MTRTELPVGHMKLDTQLWHVGGNADNPGDQSTCDPQPAYATRVVGVPAGHIPSVSQPNRASGNIHVLDGHISHGTQSSTAVKDPHPLNGHRRRVPHPTLAVESGLPPESAQRLSPPIQSGPILADPLLALAADILDDIEGVRVANENRLRQLTRDVEDKDGEERGFGLTLDHPDVARLAAMVKGMLCTSEVIRDLGVPKGSRRAVGCCLEHDAERNLKKKIRNHPLGPWIRSAHGVGDKQGARLLGAIGDPYWNDPRDRPRTLYELYAYCGLHVLSASHRHTDPQAGDADGDPPFADHPLSDAQFQSVGEGGGGHPDHLSLDSHFSDVRVAATRKRGQRITWSPKARMRAYLVAESIHKARGPYRVPYDAGRIKYADAVHQTECRRCGPAGFPAPIGSPLSKGHQHARGLRLIAKLVLKDLWREAKRLHLEMTGVTSPPACPR